VLPRIGDPVSEDGAQSSSSALHFAMFGGLGFYAPPSNKLFTQQELPVFWVNVLRSPRDISSGSPELAIDLRVASVGLRRFGAFIYKLIVISLILTFLPARAASTRAPAMPRRKRPSVTFKVTTSD